jgi:amidase/nitrilase
MLDKVMVAAAQIAPVFMNKEATINKACRAIEEAGKAGAKLIVFPETFIPGYPYWRGLQPISRWSDLMVEYQKNSILIPSGDTETLGDASKDADIFSAIGCTEMSDRKGSATLYNTILFIGNNGQILGRHRKLMPTHGERMVWGMGDINDVRVFDTDIGTIGGLVCYEHHMTLLRAAMAILGEEIHCAVWPGWWTMRRHPGEKKRYRQSDGPPDLCDIEYAIREYAFETQTFVVSVSQYIPEEALPKESLDFNVAAGGSFIVNPAGVYIKEPVFDQEAIIYGELDADDRRHTKAYFDALGHYARWDILRLEMRGEPHEPLSTWPSQEKPHPDMLKRPAEKHGAETKKLERIAEELHTKQ